MPFDPARAKSLFLQASDLPTPEARAALLEAACGGEPELKARVEALLAAEGRAGPAPQPDPTGFWAQTEPNDPESGVPTLADATAAGPARERATEWDAPGPTRALDDPDGPAPPPGRGPGTFPPGRTIGDRYRLLELLGEGGMGTVYRAEQTGPIRREVALKLIRAGLDSRNVLARFDAERQALALMDHANIARVFDAGATESRQPFFVMELVRGEPITAYCDRHRLPVGARLRLFVEVCGAVQHAHQKGIIHRDLKPTNILVAEVDGRPTPKVIDFGVAKATEASLTDLSLADTGAIVGTPTYMSPEQADPSSMDIDTRTDIYALGVILYELLAGSPPIDPAQFRRGAVLEMLRMVREVDPAKPSTRVSTAEALPSIAANRAIEPGRLGRELRGDLDWIALKALEKDRTRRYETATGLAADILRHLANEPVLAAPPSRSYRARKFVGKHRAGVVAAGLVLLALVAGVAGTTWGLVAARHAAEAERRAKFNALANERKAFAAAEGERLARRDAQEKKTLAEANERKALAAAGAEKQARETVEDVLGFVEDKVFAAARPEGQEGGLGYDVKLVDAIAAALPAMEAGFPGKPLTEARLRQTIGRSFTYLGKPSLAAAQYEAARALLEAKLGGDHPDTLAGMSELAGSYAALGRHAEAVQMREAVLAARKAKLGPDHPDTLASMHDLATSYAALGRQAEAVQLVEAVVAARKAKLGPDHPDTLASMNNLAGSYSVLGRGFEALKLREAVVAARKAKLGPDHPDTLGSMDNLAGSYFKLGRLVEAVKLFEEVVASRKAKLGPDHPDTLAGMHNLASSYAVLGRKAESLKLREDVLTLAKAKLSPDHPVTLAGMSELAGSYAALGRHAEAVPLLEPLLAARKAQLGPDHPDTLASLRALAYSYDALGRVAEMIKAYEELLPLQRTKLGPKEPGLLLSINKRLSGKYFSP